MQRVGRGHVLRLAIASLTFAALVFAPAAGTRVFQTHVDYATGTFSIPEGVAIGDLNADGKLDIVTANGYGNVSVLLGHGDGTFATHVDYGTTSGTASRARIGDVNGDNKPDLVVGNENGWVSIYLGNGNGTFQTPTKLTIGSDIYDVALADLNADGKLDIAAANNGGNAVVLLGNGDGTFQTPATYSATNAVAIAVADVNGDNKPDLVVGAQQDTYVYIGNGSGTFTGGGDYFGYGEAPSAMAVADLNGDGHPDIVGTQSTVAFVGINNGSGAFTFTQLPYLSFLGYSVTAADLNGDGKVDVVLTDNSSSAWILYGNGDGTLQSPVAVTAGQNPFDAGVADFDGNGLLDLAVANSGSLNVSVILQQLSSDDNLSTLTVSAGSLSPSFTAGTTSYTDTVPHATSSITVTPAVEDPTASVQVRINGGTYATVASGQASSSLALNVGDNPIDVLVTAENGSTKTYTVTVTRQQISSDANLSALTATASLSPSFASGTTDYTSVVDNATTNYYVFPTAEQSGATITVAINGNPQQTVGSGSQSSELGLDVGDNTVSIVVTAEDTTTTKTYTITVTRLEPYECAPTPSYPCWTQFTVDGAAPPSSLQLQTFTFFGAVQVQLKDSGDYELSNTLTHASDVHIVVLLGSYDPVVFASSGDISSYAESTGGASNSIAVDFHPSSASFNSSCLPNNCGTVNAPVTAQHDYADIFAGLVSNLGSTPAGQKNAMRGMYVSTNAQSFMFPTFDPGNHSVSFTLAAPHYKTDGSTVNTGFFKAFLPDALVEAMGIADPSTVSSGSLTVANSNGGSPAVSVSHISSPASGVVVQTTGSFSYSSPTFTISPPVDHFVVSTDAGVTAGGALAVDVTAVDANGNTVPTYLGTVTFSGGGTNATLPADYTFELGDDGTHTFSGVSLTQAGTRTITVTDTGTSSITGTTNAIIVGPAGADHLAFTSSTDDLLLGTDRDLTAGIFDQYGNQEISDSSTIVTFAQISGTGSVSGLDDEQAADGTSTDTITATSGGNIVVEATAPGLTFGSTSFYVIGTDGSGTVLASPLSVLHRRPTTVTLTYTVAAGGMHNGQVTVKVPPGWSTPTTRVTNGLVGVTAGHVTIAGNTIIVSNLTLAAGKRLVIAYGLARGGFRGAFAPATAVGNQAWTTAERAGSSGTPVPLAKSPIVSVN